MSQSTPNSRPRNDADRPKKPYPEFPLSPHPSGASQKKIRGKRPYFARWAHRVTSDALTVANLSNPFRTADPTNRQGAKRFRRA
jgi:hypothetical protein